MSGISAAGGASAASGFVAPVVQGAFTLGGLALQHKYNKELADIQNKYNIDMWKMQADYNSPQAQMERYKQAGLNPLLIYGQGNNGNMPSAPQLQAPAAPDAQGAMSELAKAFNVQNLMLNVEKIREAKAEADLAKTRAEREKNLWFAEQNFGNKYYFDYSKGKYVERPKDSAGNVSVYHPSAYYFNRILENNFNKASLIPYRSAYLEAQKNYLAPQIWMQNYEKAHYPVSYWIGQGSKVVNSATSIPKVFSPLNWKFKPGTSVVKNYYY